MASLWVRSLMVLWGSYSIAATPGRQIESVLLGTPVDNAPVDILWVIDASQASDYIYRIIKTKVDIFWEKISHSTVLHNSVVLSADDRWNLSLPINDDTNDPVLESTESNWSQNLQRRFTKAYSAFSAGAPIWVIHRFLTQLPSLPYLDKRFGRRGVPMLIFAVTGTYDHSLWAKKGTAFASWKAEDFGKGFLKKSQTRSIPLSFWAIGAKGTSPEGGCNDLKCFLQAGCETMSCQYFSNSRGIAWIDILESFADSVVLAANTYANHHFPLQKTPSDPSKIQLRLRGTLLDSQTYEYSPADNAVDVNWSLIPITIRPGDRLIITYPT